MATEDEVQKATEMGNMDYAAGVNINNNPFSWSTREEEAEAWADAWLSNYYQSAIHKR